MTFLHAYDEGDGTLEELAEQSESAWVGRKDIRSPVAHRRGGCSGMAAWTSEPGHARHSGMDPKASPSPAGSGAAGIARAAGRGAAGALVHLSMGRMWLALRQLGLKIKKALHAQEQDSEPAQRRRQA